MRIAIVHNGVVENVIEAEPDFDPAPGSSPGVAVPSDDDFFPLRNIAEEVNAATDKEAAMKALPGEYNSAYMRASIETDKTRGATNEDPEMNRESSLLGAALLSDAIRVTFDPIRSNRNDDLFHITGTEAPTYDDLYSDECVHPVAVGPWELTG